MTQQTFTPTHDENSCGTCFKLKDLIDNCIAVGDYAQATYARKSLFAHEANSESPPSVPPVPPTPATERTMPW